VPGFGVIDTEMGRIHCGAILPRRSPRCLTEYQGPIKPTVRAATQDMQALERFAIASRAVTLMARGNNG
jgi:hypothetical protein